MHVHTIDCVIWPAQAPIRSFSAMSGRQRLPYGLLGTVKSCIGSSLPSRSAEIWLGEIWLGETSPNQGVAGRDRRERAGRVRMRWFSPTSVGRGPPEVEISPGRHRQEGAGGARPRIGSAGRDLAPARSIAAVIPARRSRTGSCGPTRRPTTSRPWSGTSRRRVRGSARPHGGPRPGSRGPVCGAIESSTRSAAPRVRTLPVCFSGLALEYFSRVN